MGSAAEWKPRPLLRHMCEAATALPIALYRLRRYFLFYLIFFAISDYESDVSEVCNIHDILPDQFELIRLDLPELYSK